jgi:hypothetical protein
MNLEIAVVVDLVERNANWGGCCRRLRAEVGERKTRTMRVFFQTWESKVIATLADLGIERMQSSRFQRIARLPDDRSQSATRRGPPGSGGRRGDRRRRGRDRERRRGGGGRSGVDGGAGGRGGDSVR